LNKFYHHVRDRTRPRHPSLIVHLHNVWLFCCSSVFVFLTRLCFADRCHRKIVACNCDWTVIIPSHKNNTAIFSVIVRPLGCFTQFLYAIKAQRLFNFLWLFTQALCLWQPGHSWLVKKLSKKTTCCLLLHTKASVVVTMCS